MKDKICLISPDSFRRAKSAGFDLEAHKARCEACTVRFLREFWFDIENFFGR